MDSLDYRLGNILDAWYAEALIGGTPRNVESLALLTSGHPGTFGHYLARTPPRHIQQLSPDLVTRLAEYWWIYDYALIRKMQPWFGRSLREAMGAYFGSPLPTPAGDTCVIHFRVGDVFAPPWNFNSITLDSFAAAAHEFSRTPCRFEILSGGLHHLTTDALQQKSRRVLALLENALRERFPRAQVELRLDRRSADEDFRTMCAAPMLLAGMGSFAAAAAIANQGERLTPAVKYLLLAEESDQTVQAGHIYERWFTFPVSVVSPEALDRILARQGSHPFE